MKTTRRPVIGPEFDADQMNVTERIQAYVDTLKHYRPRPQRQGHGYATLVIEGERMIRHTNEGKDAATEFWTEWANECDAILTEWARRVVRHDYIAFGPFEHSGDVGFYYCTDSAIEDADLKIDAGDKLPTGFSGMVAEVNDHGNVTVSNYYRGRRTRTLLEVV